MEDQQLHITLRMTGLLAGYLRNTLSDAERLELEQWLAANERNREVLEELMNEEKSAADWRKLAYYRERTEKAKEELAAEIKRRTAFRTRRLFFYRAAGVLLFLVSAASVIWMTQTRKPELIVTEEEYAQNILPGSQKAQLVLSNGKSVELNKDSDTSFLQGASVKVQQQQGLLAYEDINERYEEIQFHQLITPKGGEYHLLLEDGTHVWLNAASSIRFPTRFAGRERRVQLTGEAYFEVAKDASKPFVVDINEQTNIQVLGTRFNVNAYTDEEKIHTTLLEGSVAVYTGIIGQGYFGRRILPGQRAVTEPDGKGKEATIVEPADTVRAVAWKNGVFDFNDTKLSEVMRQVSRWYNIDVVYEKGIPDIKVWGRMERNQNLQQLIKILNGMDVRVKLVSINTLIVLQ